MQPLYNREGRAVAYIADNESSIYLYDGGPAGWLHQGAVYSYDGRFLGWMMYGWLCDPEGHPAFFTDRAQGGPKRPPKLPRPVRGSREFRPQRAQRLTRPSRPGMKTTWSAHSDESFFTTAREAAEAAGDATTDVEAVDVTAEDGDAADPVEATRTAPELAEESDDPTADRRED